MKDPSDSKPWLAVGDAALSVDPISGRRGHPCFGVRPGNTTATLKILNGDREEITNYEAERNAECTKFFWTETTLILMEWKNVGRRQPLEEACHCTQATNGWTVA